MQITKISSFSLAGVLKQNMQGIAVVGYTVRPGFSNGLLMTSKQHQAGGYVGFKG
jgi:hypothetical protein